METSIGTLEAQNASKEQEASSLVWEVRRRENRVRERRNGAGLFAFTYALAGLATGGAALAIGGGLSLLAMREHGRVDDLASRRHRLESEHAEIRRRLEAHRSLRTAVQPELASLQANEAQSARAVAELQTSLAIRPRDVVIARTRLLRSRDLLGSLKGQVGVLERIQKSASAVGIALDLHLEHARADLAYAERLVAQSTRDYLRVVRIALASHPAAAAGEYLRMELVGQASSLLREAGLGREVAGVLAGALIPEPANAARLAAAIEAQL